MMLGPHTNYRECYLCEGQEEVSALGEDLVVQCPVCGGTGQLEEDTWKMIITYDGDDEHNGVKLMLRGVYVYASKMAGCRLVPYLSWTGGQSLGFEDYEAEIRLRWDVPMDEVYDLECPELQDFFRTAESREDLAICLENRNLPDSVAEYIGVQDGTTPRG